MATDQPARLSPNAELLWHVSDQLRRAYLEVKQAAAADPVFVVTRGEGTRSDGRPDFTVTWDERPAVRAWMSHACPDALPQLDARQEGFALKAVICGGAAGLSVFDMAAPDR